MLPHFTDEKLKHREVPLSYLTSKWFPTSVGWLQSQHFYYNNDTTFLRIALSSLSYRFGFCNSLSYRMSVADYFRSNSATKDLLVAP